jgi:hypothetical protein
MGLLPEGETLRIPRRNALVPLCIGVVLLTVGIWVMRIMAAKGDAGVFMVVWGAIWFFGAAAGIWSGITGLIRPPAFAVLTEEGVTFPSQHLGLIRWRDLVGVRLGLRTVTRKTKTEIAVRTPLILTVRDASVLKGKWKGFTFTHPGHTMAEGRAELLLKTDGCPLTNEKLIRKLGEHPDIKIDLSPADPDTATLGGVKLNQPSKKGWGAYLVACALITFGLSFAGVGIKNLIEASASRDWPSTPANIISAEVKTGSGGPRNSSTRYTPRITYRYTVEGQSYTSDRAAFVYSSSSDKARAFIRRFPPGAQVPAYYDPADPTEAVLVREGYGTLWIFAAFGLLFASIGGFLLKRLLVARRKARV